MKFCVYNAEGIIFKTGKKIFLIFFIFFNKREKFLTEKTLHEFLYELQHSDEEG